MKAKLFLILPVILFTHAAFALQLRSDSLLNELSSHSGKDVKQVQLLIALAEEFNWIQIDSCLLFSERAIQLAGKLHSEREMATALNYKSGALFQQYKTKEAEALALQSLSINESLHNKDGIAESYIAISVVKNDEERKLAVEKALTLFTETRNEVGIAIANFNLGICYNMNDANLSLQYFKKARDLFTKKGMIAWSAQATAMTGYEYYMLGDYENAIQYSNEVIPIAKKNNYRAVALVSYSNIAFCNYNRSYFPKAMEYAYLGQSVNQKYGSKQNEIAMMSFFGVLNMSLKNYDQAIIDFKNFLQINIGAGNIPAVIYGYQSLCDIYVQTGHYKEALSNVLAALKLSKESHNEFRENEELGSIAEVYEKLDDYESAFLYHEKYDQLNKKINDSFSYSQNLWRKSLLIKKAPDVVLRRHGIDPARKNEIAIDYLERCLAMVTKSGELEFQRNALQELSAAYERKGNAARALAYYKQFLGVKDSIMNTDNSNAIAALKFGFETEKKDQEISLLKSQQEVDRLKASQRLGINFGLGGALIGIMFVAASFYFQNRKTKKINTQLEVAYADLKNTQAQLVKSEKMAAFGIMASRVAHEIQNPLNFVNNFSELSEEIIQEMIATGDEEERKKSGDVLLANLQKIHHHGKRADQIVKQLQEHTRAGTAYKFFDQAEN